MSYIYIYRLAIILGVVSIVGCGTTTNGTKQKIAISTSTGQQAIARVNGEKITIPAKDIAVSRIKGANIQVLHEDNPCFEDTYYSISGKSKVSGAFWFNFFGLGTFGSTTDAMSGGMWEFHDPNFVVPIKQIENCKIKATQDNSKQTDSKKTNSKK